MKVTDESKTIIGLVEHVKLKEKDGLKSFYARIDTGASKSSIDKQLVLELGIGPIIRQATIKSAEGKSDRPVVNLMVVLAGKKLTGEFTIASRTHMKFPILIGRNILKHGFLIDPSKNVKKLIDIEGEK